MEPATCCRESSTLSGAEGRRRLSTTRAVSGQFEGTPRFELVRRLGEGGMGVVYEAYDSELKIPVAVKALRTLDADTLLRFKNEFRSLQDLHHPNLVSLGELIEHRGQWFFTMELIHGVDFVSWVRPRTDLSPLAV